MLIENVSVIGLGNGLRQTDIVISSHVALSMLS